MEAPSPALAGKVVLVVCAALLLAFGLLFRRRQQHGTLGGAISGPKAFWLSFAIFLWFVACPVLGLDPALPATLRAPFLAVGVSMWIRGVVEMVMLYGLKNWKPPYGIGHDVFTIVLMLVVAVVGSGDIADRRPTPLTGAAAMMLVVMMASLVLEIVHARTFFTVVGRKTMGDDGIWFADDKDPRFIAINRRTRVGNLALGIPTGLWLALWLAS